LLEKMTTSSISGLEDAHEENDQDYSSLLSSIKSISDFSRFTSVPELFGHFLDTNSWELADLAYELSLTTKDVEQNTSILLEFSKLSAEFVRPREALLSAQEKLTMFQHADPTRVSSTTIQYLLYSLQLCLVSPDMQRQQSQVFTHIVTCVEGFSRSKQHVQQNDYNDGPFKLSEDGTIGDGNDNLKDDMGMDVKHLFQYLLQFSRGIARQSQDWMSVPSPSSSTNTNKSEAQEEFASSSSDSLIGFILRIVAFFIPMISSKEKRRECCAITLQVLTIDMQVDPLHLMNLPERRKHAYWELYTSLLKTQDSRSSICKNRGLYGSGLDDRFTKGTNINITGFERFIWNNLSESGSGGTSTHRTLVQGFARTVCGSRGSITALAPVDEGVADVKRPLHETLSIGLSLSNGCALLSSTAFSDEQLDALLSELNQREEEQSALESSKLISARRLVAKSGIFCNPPHAMLGCALLSFSLLTNPNSRLPLVLSPYYLHQLAENILPTLLRHDVLATQEGLELFIHMGNYLDIISTSFTFTFTPNFQNKHQHKGYVFVPCTAVDAPQSSLPPSECSSAVGTAAITSHLAAFIALRSKLNLSELESKSPNASNESIQSAKLLRSKCEDIRSLGQLLSLSKDILSFIQSSIMAITNCYEENLSRQGFNSLKKHFQFFEPRSLFLLLRHLVKDFPFPGLLAPIIDVAVDKMRLASSEDDRIRINKLEKRVERAFLASEYVNSISDSLAKERILEDKMFKEQEDDDKDEDDNDNQDEQDDENRNRKQEKKGKKENTRQEDFILSHKNPWFSPLVFEAFSIPLKDFENQFVNSKYNTVSNGTDKRMIDPATIVSHLLQGMNIGGIEAAISMQTFIMLKLKSLKLTGSENRIIAFWGSVDEMHANVVNGSIKNALSPYYNTVRNVSKLVNDAISAVDSNNTTTGDIDTVSLASDMDRARLDLLAMNVARLLELYKLKDY